MTEFQIKTKDFEGPIELLFNLIEGRKLHISQISLAQVADDYINYVKRFHGLPLGETAQFLVIVSTLLLIKSKSLLPGFTLSEEEKESVKDLEHRLEIYREIREKTKIVSGLFGKAPLFAASPGKDFPIIFAPTRDLSLQNLYLKIKDLIASLPKPEALAQAAVKKVISLEEVIKNLTERISRHLKLSFREFSGFGKKEKVNVIVSFLAMLELVKQGMVAVRQLSHFSDIEMETEKYDSVPKYN